MKIVSSRSIGIHRTYSPEMRSSQHNYVTEDSCSVHRNSHGISYCLVALRSLFLKSHFAPEWWAAVMSDCSQDKLVQYMGIAKSEDWEPTEITKLGHQYEHNSKSVKFNTLNLRNLTPNFSVTGNTINQGLIGIKGIGKKAAKKFEGFVDFVDINDFIDKKGGKDKSALERFIKLGAFRDVPGHGNAKALWDYYKFHYCSGKDITVLKKTLRSALLEDQGWSEDAIEIERNRQIKEYRKAYPKRNVIPKKLSNWKPVPDTSVSAFMKLYGDDDFSLDEVLNFEMEYYGYYLNNPLDLYQTKGGSSIKDVKRVFELETDYKIPPFLEVVVDNVVYDKTKNGNKYCKLYVTDGIQKALIILWEDFLTSNNRRFLKVGTGIQVHVLYDPERKTFTIPKECSTIIPLIRRDDAA